MNYKLISHALVLSSGSSNARASPSNPNMISSIESKESCPTDIKIYSGVGKTQDVRKNFRLLQRDRKAMKSIIWGAYGSSSGSPNAHSSRDRSLGKSMSLTIVSRLVSGLFLRTAAGLCLKESLRVSKVGAALRRSSLEKRCYALFCQPRWKSNSMWVK
jgi:hypothetical protein